MAGPLPFRIQPTEPMNDAPAWHLHERMPSGVQVAKSPNLNPASPFVPAGLIPGGLLPYNLLMPFINLPRNLNLPRLGNDLSDIAALLLERNPDLPNSRSVGEGDYEDLGEWLTFFWGDSGSGSITWESTSELQAIFMAVNELVARWEVAEGNLSLEYNIPGNAGDMSVTTFINNGSLTRSTDVHVDITETEASDGLTTKEYSAIDDMFVKYISDENTTFHLEGIELFLYLVNLPTSLPAEANRVWNNGGVLNIT